MKTQSFLLSLFAVLFISVSAFAQQSKTENIKVWGNCGMCKKTIETAAKEAGATEANWNTETKILAVSYKGGDNKKIQQAIANAGYDTQDFTAPAAAYDKLHECCKYDRKNTESKASAAGDKCCDGKDGKCAKCAKGEKADCCKDGKCDKCAKGEKADCCKDGKSCKETGCCKA